MVSIKGIIVGFVHRAISPMFIPPKPLLWILPDDWLELMGAVSLMQGLSGISKDVPPFTIAAGKNSIAGINILGLRRAGYGRELRKEVQEAFALYYSSGLNTSQVQAQSGQRSWSREVSLFWDFIGTTKRGICPRARWREVKASTLSSDEG